MHVASTKPSSAALLALVFSLILSSSVARADGGKITFSGAISAPTCATSAELTAVSAPSDSALSPQRRVCIDPGKLVSSSKRFYASTAVRLSENETDKVLQYFDRYIKAGRPDAQAPVLLTQTYE